ncbi:hypothetical protein LK459_17235 [Gordonia otitidis]|uniref:hypothetical protein n=1 Tax=Gordonia otitidis TaxID=249058 RepID=UPI001D135606|nr:hypothetical protein [Gordonia otitidis]UEA58313.1 hypothetical protein LK459_17235 [Gordonia otitidis]
MATTVYDIGATLTATVLDRPDHLDREALAAWMSEVIEHVIAGRVETARRLARRLPGPNGDNCAR